MSGAARVGGSNLQFEIWPGEILHCHFKDSCQAKVVVASSGDVSDGAWHFVMCRRRGSTFTLTIDSRTWSKSASLGSISNSESLSIGAKNTSEDHYVGLMDEVAMTIG